MVSEELKNYCQDKLFGLAIGYEATLHFGVEYEQCFYEVMQSLFIPRSDQDDILAAIKYNTSLGRIPYHKLSPVNQYLVAVGPYIGYCLTNNPLPNITEDEIGHLLENEEFRKFLTKLGEDTAQKVKGALWKPGAGCLGKAAMFLLLSIVFVLCIIFILQN